MCNISTIERDFKLLLRRLHSAVSSPDRRCNLQSCAHLLASHPGFLQTDQGSSRTTCPSWSYKPGQKKQPPESPSTRCDGEAGTALTFQVPVKFLQGFLELPGDKEVFVPSAGCGSFLRSREDQREREGIYFSHYCFTLFWNDLRKAQCAAKFTQFCIPRGPALGAAGTQTGGVCACAL